MKSAGDETIVERGTPQLNVQELEQEQQLTLHEHETQEAFSEHEGETQGALSELEEETQEALSEHEREQQHKEGEAEPVSGSAKWERPALPALRIHDCSPIPVFCFLYSKILPVTEMRLNVCLNEMALFGPFTALIKGCSSYGRNGGHPTRGDG